jgi:hypothetical protein
MLSPHIANESPAQDTSKGVGSRAAGQMAGEGVVALDR